jgi:hypothetical protein
VTADRIDKRIHVQISHRPFIRRVDIHGGNQRLLWGVLWDSRRGLSVRALSRWSEDLGVKSDFTAILIPFSDKNYMNKSGR